MKKILTKNEADLLTLLTDSGYSKTKAKQLVKHGAVAVGDKEATRADQLVSAGKLVCVRSEQEMREQAKSCPGLSIIYEDEAIIVIDKPAGLLTIATEKEKRKTAYYLLSSYLKERAKSTKARIFIVHRLDQGTSGLLVFAKNEAVKQILQDGWEHADKRYTAIVEGVPREKEGQIASTLSESKALRVYTVRGTSEEGKEARTNYKVIKESDAYALLDITLLTGRKNQIRVHMADIGHPIAGDKKYGAKTNPLHRLALHAYHLSFNHPTSPEKRMEFEIPTPGKFHMLFSKKKER
ncbi:MAG: RluA family pseudouridine synthase [Proteobacteria bacterium]|nr:RluA family pseudouridine synthase [Pseudomonadota bacterium]MBU1649557.1 RluA family pseudouridine synthase [Pseudomonadota bacterium]